MVAGGLGVSQQYLADLIEPRQVTAGISGLVGSGQVWTGCSGSQWVSACLGRFGRSRWVSMGLDGGSWQVSPGLGRSNQVLTHLDWSWLVSVGLSKSHRVSASISGYFQILTGLRMCQWVSYGLEGLKWTWQFYAGLDGSPQFSAGLSRPWN